MTGCGRSRTCSGGSRIRRRGLSPPLVAACCDYCSVLRLLRRVARGGIRRRGLSPPLVAASCDYCGVLRRVAACCDCCGYCGVLRCGVL